MDNRFIPVLVIVGPTASGKTSLSIELAKKYDGEIISADSMQIYKQMNIGSAKPSKEEMQGIPHYLIDFLDISKDFSVANYVDMAHPIIKDIYSRGKIPIVCGGTGLYIDSLIDNIQFQKEIVDESLRNNLNEKAKKHGIEYLLEELKKIDKDSFIKLKNDKNQRKVIRAIEIYETTGFTMTEQIKNSRSIPSPYRPTFIGLDFVNRDILYKRIEKRVDKMIENGLINEAYNIINSDYSKTAIGAIGYKEFIPYFEKKIVLDDCINRIKINTRHYAKRQITWFKRNKQINWILRENDDSVDTSLEKCFKILNSF